MNAKQLRNSLLQEAIQGRLVPQNADDEPASVLLRRIRKEKEQLVKDGKLKKKDLEIKPITEDEKPFEIPKSWEWCILGDVFAHNNGKQLNKGVSQGTMMDYITTSNLYWDHFVLDNLKQMPFEDKEIERCQAIKGDLLVCEGGDIGRSAIWNYDFPIMLQNHIHKLRAFSPVCTKYFYYVLFLYNMTGKIGGKGIGIQGFSSSAVHNTAIPLPPLAEQRRIVEKLERLLPLVERYDKAQTELNQLNEALPEQLKKSILQEAIQGRLVPQNADDEPASMLLKKIRKKDIKFTNVVNFEDYIYDIPATWEWCKLYEISDVLGGFAFQSGELKSNDGYRVIRISDVTPNGLSNKSVVKCNNYNVPSQYQIQNNDILMAMTGGTVGKSLLLRHIDEILYLNQRVAMIRAKQVDFEYLNLIIKSPFIQGIISDVKNSTNDNISMADIKSFPIPLPPLAEQRRIVAKIEALFAAVGR